MRDNIATAAPMDTLARCVVDTPFNATPNEQKPLAISVSSNVYYGYQPLTRQTNHERVDSACEDILNKTFSEMDTDQYEADCLNRKRTRDQFELSCNQAKRKRHNEPTKLDLNPHNKQFKSLSTEIDEELLRETHGCTYYHWVSSNV
ncbi:uncharacterized protein LOC126737625 [Anthonomus grandis grandis]|uniref:uncharacterized protein LOC126737625 n=1 Tax=Anthonomus grandis grandis TaxID=2921223 RepID=UPI00216658E6|nr:uncharacterized protein LOC126737625 [Anthonomus grandis grandis]